jgi:hypothetical protein
MKKDATNKQQHNKLKTEQAKRMTFKKSRGRRYGKRWFPY